MAWRVWGSFIGFHMLFSVWDLLILESKTEVLTCFCCKKCLILLPCEFDPHCLKEDRPDQLSPRTMCLYSTLHFPFSFSCLDESCLILLPCKFDSHCLRFSPQKRKTVVERQISLHPEVLVFFIFLSLQGEHCCLITNTSPVFLFSCITPNTNELHWYKWIGREQRSCQMNCTFLSWLDLQNHNSKFPWKEELFQGVIYIYIWGLYLCLRVVHVFLGGTCLWGCTYMC